MISRVKGRENPGKRGEVFRLPEKNPTSSPKIILSNSAEKRLPFPCQHGKKGGGEERLSKIEKENGSQPPTVIKKKNEILSCEDS